MQNIIDKEAVTLSRLEASKVLLTVQEQEVEQAKAEVAEERKAAAENLLRKQNLEKRAEAQEMQVANLVSMRANAQAEAEKARQADLETLESLEQERDRIAEILQAARRGGSSPGRGGGRRSRCGRAVSRPVPLERLPGLPGDRRDHVAVRLAPAPDLRLPLAARRHRLRRPTAALRSTPRPTARSSTSTSRRAWGNRIIIDHGWQRGVGLATISNHLSSYAVAVGDHVKRGQIVGFVGTTGWSTGCHLHFTVLQNGEPVDPMQWF